MMPASRNDFLGAFDSVPAPASLIAWLQRQPRSVIVGQCLGALHRSPLKLTQHLLMRLVTLHVPPLYATPQCLMQPTM